MTLQKARLSLKKLANKKNAKSTQKFFKTGPGDYGAGDIFMGVTMPKLRMVARQFKDMPLSELTGLIQSKIHEERMLGLVILTLQFKAPLTQKNEQQQDRIFAFYLKHRRHINNWDLIDVTAPIIVGGSLLNKNRSILYRFAQSKSLWERRMAIISTLTFIRNQDFKDTLQISELLLKDSHDLIHKAVGWMLREVGKKEERVLLSFLKIHVSKMPRVTLRYSIERLSPSQRQFWLHQ